MPSPLYYTVWGIYLDISGKFRIFDIQKNYIYEGNK